MKKHSQWLSIVFLLLIVGGLAFHFGYNNSDGTPTTVSTSAPRDVSSLPASAEQSIDRLTQQKVVVDYMRQHGRLPDYYITKSQARSQGWDARDGNLCSTLPGKAIGGDRFSNREKRLPQSKGRQWFEADINYRCGHRGAERLLYSNDGLIYVTHDHYQRFTEVSR
ncbi:Ribonuclease precursor [Leminorella richardii]|uniref:Ribonuclease n=1 Tax=Leminorella richardii TaxID=158841 RepID=A0A2X4VDE8_9GAMM|nr:ribonuclease domain-containing protein [Leminorella richardii]SQI43290.1 Ribonuclease precursor [Leminorella richardii]